MKYMTSFSSSLASRKLRIRSSSLTFAFAAPLAEVPHDDCEPPESELKSESGDSNDDDDDDDTRTNHSSKSENSHSHGQSRAAGTDTTRCV